MKFKEYKEELLKDKKAVDIMASGDLSVEEMIYNLELLGYRIVKNCKLQNVSNNEADLDCDYEITVKLPFKTKRYKIKVI